MYKECCWFARTLSGYDHIALYASSKTPLNTSFHNHMWATTSSVLV